MPVGKGDPQSRVASKALGAGALLDIGIYPLTWASLILDKSPARQHKASPDLTATMTFYDETKPAEKIDEQVTVVLKYSDLKAQAICSASLLYKSGEEFARIEGSKGSIAIGGIAASKPRFLIVRIQNEEEKKKLDFDVPGFGLHYEADAVGENIRAGKQENATCSWRDTLTVMRRLDAVRKTCSLTYPQDE